MRGNALRGDRCLDAASQDALGASLRDRGPRLPAGQPVCSSDLGRIGSWRPEGLSVCGLGRARFGELQGFALHTSFSEHHPLQLEQDSLRPGCPLRDTMEHAGNSGAGETQPQGGDAGSEPFGGPRVERGAAKLATMCRALDLSSTCVGLVPCPPGRGSRHGEKPGTLLGFAQLRGQGPDVNQLSDPVLAALS